MPFVWCFSGSSSKGSICQSFQGDESAMQGMLALMRRGFGVEAQAFGTVILSLVNGKSSQKASLNKGD